MVQLEDLTKIEEPEEPCKPEKPTLLSKYGIPVQHLEYEHIEKCRNGRELEKILHVLKSGEEGYFPHLIQTTEKRLAEIKPNSKLLRKVCPVLNKNQISKDDLDDLSKDLHDWMEDMHQKDRELKETKVKSNLYLTDSDVRKSIGPMPQPTTKETCKRIASTDYESWDKYDPDTEILKMNLKEEKLKNEALKQHKANIKMPKSVRFNKFRTEAEALFEANREKEQGNECFKVGELQTALQHYTNSLECKPLAMVYTNRALVYSKLEKYNMAIDDCEAALRVEPRNLKAHLRMAQAYEALQRYGDALTSAENAVEIDPNNWGAQELSNRMRKRCGRAAAVNKRFAIQDVEFIGTDARDDVRSECAIKGQRNEGEASPDVISAKSAFVNDFDAKPLKSILKSTKNSTKQKDRIGNDVGSTNSMTNIKFDKSIIKTNATLWKQKGQEINYEVIPIPGTSSMPPPYFKVVYSNDPKVIQREKQNILHRPMLLHIATIYTTSDDESEKDSNFVNKTNQENILKDHQQENNRKHPVKHEDDIEDFKFSDDKKTEDNHKQTWNKIRGQKPSIVTNERIVEDSRGAGGEPCGNEILFPTEEELRSPYKFIETWNSIRKDTSFKQHVEILKKLDFSIIHNVIGYKLDDTMLSIMFHCLYRYFMVPGELDRLHAVLKNLTLIPRFKVMLMFLGEPEWKCIRALIEFLDQHGHGLPHNIRTVYCH